MVSLMQLWLPILLSAVAVFIVSSIVHMVLKWHASDYHGFSNEDEILAAIRKGNPSPGIYMTVTRFQQGSSPTAPVRYSPLTKAVMPSSSSDPLTRFASMMFSAR